ncbi:MAG: hypothetical protein A2X05_15640 [Bacteroidetes bacterium GWE2_41_25]|nr:MAG: hypothetical protein A2X03_03555 [Bacteroidetes bacterium GWA2_40_15]OFX92811.1 MAG: hypothetical protein A2X06_00800 [Bacteroidetes bacterium GWC2_40_22]OFY07932.1 MAG: hypothetical protein A2X05_15640 [Bacteroidetes bacterium GWE2_41_25]OFY58573.1 MAG: hypothetical protein A2X04_17045 [Bacteroidetes bacterium GWF2_41_9]HAM10495.1 hypothetical protein [Bacteroidales bacterium]
MRSGFIFDKNLCVGCKSCSAACILEYSFKIKPRSVFTCNSDVSAALPIISLSIACNHCNDNNADTPAWFPENGLNPAMKFKGRSLDIPHIV